MFKIIIDDVSSLKTNEISALSQFFSSLNNTPQLISPCANPEDMPPISPILDIPEYTPPPPSSPAIKHLESIAQKYEVNDSPVQTYTKPKEQYLEHDDIITEDYADVVNTSDVELDSKGIPWDSRIHAKNKSMTTQGEWKLGRHLDPSFVRKVKTELRSKALVPKTVKKTQKPVIGVPPPPPIAVPKPPAFVDETQGFVKLINRVTEAQKTGAITKQQIADTLRVFNMPSLAMVSTRMDLLPSISAEFDKIIG